MARQRIRRSLVLLALSGWVLGLQSVLAGASTESLDNPAADNVAPDEFPFLVQVHSFNRNSTEVVCGGSIIDKNIILTSYHCLFDAISVSVKFGCSRNSTHCRGTVWADHLAHTDGSSYALAMLRLREPFQFRNSPPALKRIKLAGPTWVNYTQAGRLTSAGWGLWRFGDPARRRKLRKLEIGANQVMDCHSVEKANTNNICAKIPPRDYRAMDQGGPLMSRVGGRLHLVGVVQGQNCRTCTTVSTRISAKRSWIETSIDKLNKLPRPSDDEAPLNKFMLE